MQQVKRFYESVARVEKAGWVSDEGLQGKEWKFKKIGFPQNFEKLEKGDEIMKKQTNFINFH